MRYEKLKNSTQNPIVRKLCEIILEKETNIALSCDETTSDAVLKLADEVGPKICMLKMHIDIIEDFTPDLPGKLKELAKKHNFLVFEDRKFADIGNTVQLQYEKGIYKIADWADVVNAHTVPGPGIIQGLKESAEKQQDERGVIILAQMTPEGTLATGEYTEKSVEMSKQFGDFVLGFIASSQPDEIRKMRELAGDQFVFFSPGVKLQAGGDGLGQRYSTPADVIGASSDVLIVGRGIYQAENPAEEAEKYRVAGWEAAQNS